MNIPARRKERFLRDPVPVRLGGIAADLARVSSCAQHEGSNDTVAMMLEESLLQLHPAGSRIETDQ